MNEEIAGEAAVKLGAPHSLGYMPSVDGLRAISILGVVAFHAGIAGVPGGFAGVDVFFVISGFLIVGQIIAELEAGRFSILAFYARRAMRILPPYFAMLTAVALVAPFLLIVPKSYEAFAKAAVLSPLMVSNILFFFEQGYFDPSADQKPLIHTWTLSVEEQFYLVVPFALLALFRLGSGRFGRRGAWLAIAAGIASFLACVQYTSVSGRNPAFYLTHLRAWEFIAGGLAMPLASILREKAGDSIPGVLAGTGLALIAAVFFGMDATVPFPGWRAAVPVLGAVLVLAGTVSAPRSLAAIILSHPVPVRIGLVSYSWYLWHWPVLSLAGLADLGPENSRGILFAGVVGYLLAELSYRYIELPVKAWRFRRAAIVGDKKIFLSGMGAAFSVAVICGGMAGMGYLSNQAWLERVYGVEPKARAGACHIVTGDSLPPGCLKGDYILLLGDSHADAVAQAFAAGTEKLGFRLVVLARGGCNLAWFTPQARASNRLHSCSNLLGPLEAVLAADEPPKTAIIISKPSTWDDGVANPVLALASMFSERGTATLFVGPVPIFGRPALECVVQADRRGEKRDMCALSRSVFSLREASASAFIGSGISGRADAAFAPVGDVFCDDVLCRPWEGNKLLFWDTDHVVSAGAEKIFDAILPKLKVLLAARSRSG